MKIITVAVQSLIGPEGKQFDIFEASVFKIIFTFVLHFEVYHRHLVSTNRVV